MAPVALLAPANIAGTSAVGPAPGRGRVRLLNQLLDRAWRLGWASTPTLDPDALIAKAAALTRTEPDDADNGWRDRLRLLCSDLEAEAALTDLGRTIAHGQLVAALSNRFRAHALWTAHPEILEQPLARPIVIVGQMRSGTTRMQRLLACDSRLTYTRCFESWNPVPARAGRAIDDRKLRGWLGMACARLVNPGFAAIHPSGWNAPDEEIGLQCASIFGSAYEAQWRVPRYVAHIETADAVPVYREFRRLLQTIAWLRGDAGDRPWVLKVPQFAQDLSALLTVLPDARVVRVMRDRDAVIASSASLVRNQMAIQSDAVDPPAIGREWTRKVALRDARMAAALAGSDVPRVEVDYDEVGRDWAGAMQRVYRMLGLPLTGEVQGRMAAYLRASRRARRPHVYDPAAFGLPVAADAPAVGGDVAEGVA
jgi:hypothetical protein